MRDSYEEFLQRFVRCRHRKNLTQEEVSTRLGITQSQFSKMELGKIVIPYHCLRVLLEAGWDVDYLITGKESAFCVSELSTWVTEIKERDKKVLLSAFVWLLEQGIEKSTVNISFETKCELEILKKRAGEEKADSVLQEVRRISGFTQIPMSEKLGVNIKKYRMLEKKKAGPDAELLLRIYEATGCKPSFLLEAEDIEGKIIDDLWHQIMPEVREKILPLAEQILYFLEL